MTHPVALQAVVKVRQREILEEAEWRRRAQAAFDGRKKAPQIQVPLARNDHVERLDCHSQGIL
jgi:hypothetical protein